MNSKKPFEHIEDRIKQAAENYQPPFDAKAWKAMEAKLDGDKKKRRPFIWWLAIPLLLAGLYGIYKVSNGNKQTIVSAGKQEVVEKANEEATAGNESNNATASNTPTEKNDRQKNIEQTGKDFSKPSGNSSLNASGGDGLPKPTSGPFKNSYSITKAKSIKKVPVNKIGYTKKGKLGSVTNSGEVGMADENNIAANEKPATNDELSNTDAAKVDRKSEQKDELIEKEKNDIAALENKKQEEIKEDKKTVLKKAEETKPVAKKKDEKTKLQKGFYIQATTGTDAGGTKLFSYSNCSFKPKYGLGIGYQFSKRLSAQSGFYATNKKYTAMPADYNIKPGSPMSTYRIDIIKALCTVYEIPLAVKYDFVSKPSLVVFGTAGISSYLMKKEKYDCFYSYYNYIYEKEWLFSGNSHLFSTAVFSLGIEKKVWNQLSLLAEPSFGFPLKGVGDGKMKIYSSSVQLGLKYYLFKKQ